MPTHHGNFFNDHRIVYGIQGTKANGMDGFDTELKFNSALHVKHLETLVELQKDKTYDYAGRTNAGEGRFTSGECPIFLTSSAFFGNVKANAKFAYGSAQSTMLFLIIALMTILYIWLGKVDLSGEGQR